MEWNQLVGSAINTVLVLAIVQAAKVYIPKLHASVPWMLPILSGAVGPAVAAAQNAIADALGVPVDLSPLVAVFTGATATAVHQVGRQSGVSNPVETA